MGGHQGISKTAEKILTILGLENIEIKNIEHLVTQLTEDSERQVCDAGLTKTLLSLVFTLWLFAH